jgi:hypothetical protein
MGLRLPARFCCAALAVAGSALAHPLPAPHALAHDWYPLECCAERDCAPADTVVRREDGSYLVTSRGMSVAIPRDYRNWRQAPDGRLHVCLRQLRSGSVYLICAFRGPGV